jgi:predicted nucleotidyltransferase
MNQEIHRSIPKQDQVVAHLSRRPDFIFAYLFGSYAAGEQNEVSDIDLALYVQGEGSLMEQGLVVSELEMITGCDVDLVVLNGMIERNPQLAYDIVFGGTLLFSRNDELLAHYRRRTLHYFFDTEPIREMVRAGLEYRLSHGTFAKFEDA